MRSKIKFLPLLLSLLLLVGCTALPSGKAHDNIVEVNADNFEQVLSSGKTVLLDFYADWCGPCKLLAPILEEVAAEREDVIIGKINVDEESLLAAQFGIQSIPTMVVFKNGTLTETAVGLRSKAQILAML